MTNTYKKADVYITEKGNEVRISVDVTEEKTIEGMLSKIAYTIVEHNFIGASLRSIYFCEEVEK